MKGEAPEWNWDSLLFSAMKVGLKPAEFWSMSMREVDYAVRAYQWRYDKDAELLAHLTACVINMWSKRRIKGRDLYRPAENRPATIIDKEARRREFEQTVAIMGPEAIPVKLGSRRNV